MNLTNKNDFAKIIPPYHKLVTEHEDNFYKTFNTPMQSYVGLGGFEVDSLFDRITYFDNKELYENLSPRDVIAYKFSNDAAILIDSILKDQERILEAWKNWETM